MEAANRTHDDLADQTVLPTEHPSVTNDVAGLRFLVGQAASYREVVSGYPQIACTLGVWTSETDHYQLITEVTSRVINHSSQRGGNVVLIEMRR